MKKNCQSCHQSGFTLIEMIIAMTTVSIVSVATMYILFLSLNLRDLTITSSKTEESLRVFDRTMRMAATQALAITGGGSSILIRGKNECWSFAYDSLAQNVEYSKIVQTDCNPDPNPSSSFFSASTKVISMNFLITPLSSGGRQVKVDGTFQTTLPLDVFQTSFSNAYVNLVD